MRIFVTALCLLSITATFAQKGIDRPETDDYLTNRFVTPLNDPLDVAGSPYAEQDFQSGNVYKNGKLVASNVSIRYNVSRDEIEVKNEATALDRQARVLESNPDIYVRVLNDVYVYVKPSTEEAPFGYFEVLHEGEKFHLYKKLRKEYIEGKKAINSVARDIPPTYKDKEDLYLVHPDGTLTELSGSKNRKIKAFPSHNKELKKYIKENDLNINKEYSLEKLVAYFNTLK